MHAVNFPAAKCGLVTADYLQIYPPNQTTPVSLHYTSQTCAKKVQILTISVVQAGSGGPVGPPRGRGPHRSRPGTTRSRAVPGHPLVRHTAEMGDRNVLGGELEPCGTDPVTGFYRDGCCNTGPEDRGSHTICAVVTAEFLDHQRRIGNDLSTPVPQYRFPGLVPGDRWCVTAANWLRAHQDGAASPVVLASTHERALEVVPLEALQQHSVERPRQPRRARRVMPAPAGR